MSHSSVKPVFYLEAVYNLYRKIGILESNKRSLNRLDVSIPIIGYEVLPHMLQAKKATVENLLKRPMIPVVILVSLCAIRNALSFTLGP